MRVNANVYPPEVGTEKRWDGKLVARLTENVIEVPYTDENGNTVISYDYDEYEYIADWKESAKRRIEANPAYYLQKAKDQQNE